MSPALLRKDDRTGNYRVPVTVWIPQPVYRVLAKYAAERKADVGMLVAELTIRAVKVPVRHRAPKGLRIATRRRQVAAMATAGKTAQVIAAELGLSTQTIYNDLDAIRTGARP